MDYHEFLDRKTQVGSESGFDPLWLPDFLYPFQASLVEWAIRKGRAAIFADCGLGKTPMQLVWAENVVRKTNKPVLIMTPLAVGAQTIREGQKFGIEAKRSSDGKIPEGAKIIVTNYERLHYFDSADFAGAVCDESSILKNFKGETKAEVTEFMRTLPYRLLCTATASPNDYIELGTSSEALGEMGFMDMLGKFFKNQNNNCATGRAWAARGGGEPKWRFRGHAERDFWRWVCSWARAIRKPSDLGFEDNGFILPPLNIKQHIVKTVTPRPGLLFDLPAISLEEQRDERRRTIKERCEKAAEIIAGAPKPVVAWCHLNGEGDTLEKIIPDSVQISGDDEDEVKERAFIDFQDGKIPVLITKPRIGGFGMNWQHCSRQTFFPSHSFEQWYQAIRRSWRFGQKRPVQVDIITSEGEAYVLENMQRKSVAADAMFASLVGMMNNELKIKKIDNFKAEEEIPSWL